MQIWWTSVRIRYAGLKQLWRVRGPLALEAAGVRGVRGVRFYGLPIVRMPRGSPMARGPRVLFCSTSRFTALRVAHPETLRTLNRGTSIRNGALADADLATSAEADAAA